MGGKIIFENKHEHLCVPPCIYYNDYSDDNTICKYAQRKYAAGTKWRCDCGYIWTTEYIHPSSGPLQWRRSRNVSYVPPEDIINPKRPWKKALKALVGV